jgi:hypothetical protein
MSSAPVENDRRSFAGKRVRNRKRGRAQGEGGCFARIDSNQIERRAVSTSIDEAMNAIAVEKRQAVPFLAAFVVTLRRQVPKAIHAMGDRAERRFSEFAGLPYQSRASRQHWEELWEAERQPATSTSQKISDVLQSCTTGAPSTASRSRRSVRQGRGR